MKLRTFILSWLIGACLWAAAMHFVRPYLEAMPVSSGFIYILIFWWPDFILFGFFPELEQDPTVANILAIAFPSLVYGLGFGAVVTLCSVFFRVDKT